MRTVRAVRLATGAVLVVLALCAAGCTAGEIPVVDGPRPAPERALAAADTQPPATARLPKPWLLYDRPAELYGVPVLEPEGPTEWAVTGRWSAGDDGSHQAIAGRQYWVVMGRTFAWWRLTGEVAPWGRVHLWAQLPADWIVVGRDAVPGISPPRGAGWDSVPYSLGHVLADSRGVELRACPAGDCPIAGRPQDGELVPVSGRLTDAAGREWHRVEYRQTILWTPARRVRVPMDVAWPRARPPAGWRSCEPLVLFGPPPHTLCAVDAEGRFVDGRERERDRLDPVFGRLPPTGVRSPKPD